MIDNHLNYNVHFTENFYRPPFKFNYVKTCLKIQFFSLVRWSLTLTPSSTCTSKRSGTTTKPSCKLNRLSPVYTVIMIRARRGQKGCCHHYIRQEGAALAQRYYYIHRRENPYVIVHVNYFCALSFHVL